MSDPHSHYGQQVSALLIAPPHAPEAMQALEMAGIRVRMRADFAEAEAELDHPADIVAIEAGTAPSDLLAALLARADTLATEQYSSIMVAINPDQLDLTATLFGPRRHILCDPSPSERVATAALARAEAMARDTVTLHDAARDAEYGRLQRLNEEVARIAETLARLTRSEEAERRTIRDPGREYRGPDDGADGGTPLEIAPQEIRTVIRARRLRSQFFATDLFADPAWDMLLDLFAAGLEHRRVSVSSLCIAAAVPPTTALRWIGTLHDAGLFERQADPSDRRRAYIGLSAKGVAGMRNYVGAAKRAGLGLV